MPNILRTSEELIDTIEAEHNTHGIDSEMELSFISALTESFKTAITEVNESVLQYYSRGIVDLATSEDLDEKTAELGTQRGAPAELADETYTNFNVYIANGIAKDFAIDTNSPIVIPKLAISITDIAGYQYTITDDIVIEPDAFSGYSPIVATTTEVGTVSIDDINSCTVDTSEVINLDPTKADQIIFNCRNTKAITSEAADDSDEALREQAFLRVNAMNNTNEDAIRLALSRYGITDISFKHGLYGFGTIGVLIRVGGAAQLSDTTIKVLNNLLANVCPFARVIVPEIMQVKISLNVIFMDPTISVDTKVLIEEAIRAYFSDLNPGDSMNIDEILDSTRAIENVDKANIQCILIDDRKCIVRNQIALADQLYALQETDPIVYAA